MAALIEQYPDDFVYVPKGETTTPPAEPPKTHGATAVIDEYPDDFVYEPGPPKKQKPSPLKNLWDRITSLDLKLPAEPSVGKIWESGSVGAPAPAPEPLPTLAEAASVIDLTEGKALSRPAGQRGITPFPESPGAAGRTVDEVVADINPMGVAPHKPSAPPEPMTKERDLAASTRPDDYQNPSRYDVVPSFEADRPKWQYENLKWEAGKPVRINPKAFGDVFSEGIKRLPALVKASISATLQGSNVPAPGQSPEAAGDFIGSLTAGYERAVNASIDKGEKAAESLLEYAGKKYGDDAEVFPGITVKDVAELPPNASYSVVAAIAGLSTGVPSSYIAGPAAGWTAGTAAVGVASFRMTKNQFLRDVVQKPLDQYAMATHGRHITPEEWNQIKSRFDKAGTYYALWEAIPEALGDAATLGIWRLPASAFFKLPMVKNAVVKSLATVGAKYTADQIEELVTETISQKGQGDIEAAIGARAKAPTWGEAAGEVAPQTVMLTTFMGGATGIGSHVYDRLTAGLPKETAPGAAESDQPIKGSSVISDFAAAAQEEKAARAETPGGFGAFVQKEAALKPAPENQPMASAGQTAGDVAALPVAGETMPEPIQTAANIPETIAPAPKPAPQIPPQTPALPAPAAPTQPEAQNQTIAGPAIPGPAPIIAKGGENATGIRKNEGQVLPGEETGMVPPPQPGPGPETVGGPTIRQRPEEGGQNLEQHPQEQPGGPGPVIPPERDGFVYKPKAEKREPALPESAQGFEYAPPGKPGQATGEKVIPFKDRPPEEKKIIDEYNKKMDSEEWVKAYENETDMEHFTKDEGHSPLADELIKDLKREGLTKGANILEIGSGQGRDGVFLAKKGHNVRGVDVSAKAVGIANDKAKNKTASFEVGDAENLYQFEDESQDAVYSIAALHGTPIKFTFKEIFRVLKPGGQAKLFLYTRTKTGSKWISYWTPGEIKQYAKENGFKVEKFREGHDIEPITIPGVKGRVEQESHLVVTTLRKPKTPIPSKPVHPTEKTAPKTSIDSDIEDLLKMSAAEAEKAAAAEKIKAGMEKIKAGAKAFNDLFGEAGELSNKPVDPEKWPAARAALLQMWEGFRETSGGIKEAAAAFIKEAYATLSSRGKAYIDKFIREDIRADLARETAGGLTTGPEKINVKEEEGVSDGTIRPKTETTPEGVQTEPVPGAETGKPAGSVLPGTGRRGPKTAGKPHGAGRPSGLRSGRDRDQGPPGPVDYQITPADNLGAGGAKQKFHDNLAAIRLLKEIGDRQATPEEQSILVKYVGWGGIPQAFVRPDGSVAKGWESEAKELQEALTGEEYAAARSTTQDAHYTSEDIVRAVYQGLSRLGFKGGKILEPAVGTGNFIGLMPLPVRSRSHITGVEIDPLTAAIAKQLYPHQSILHSGFENFSIVPDSFDAAVGNPPFGSKTMFDPGHKELKGFSIHNYFFAKSLIGLRPGGVLSMVVSSSMMDKQGAAQREWIRDHADLLGAIRLPNNAFKGNANTEVTTDIIFLRKRKPGTPIAAPRWMRLREVEGAGGVKYRINEYFADHPEMMLGQVGPNKLLPAKIKNGVYDAVPGMLPKEGIKIKPALTEAISKLPEDIYQPGQKVEDVQKPEILVSDPGFAQPYGYALDDSGRAVRRLPDVNGEQEYEPVLYGGAPLAGKRLERFRGLLKIRDAVRRLIRAEVADDPAMTKYRADLNRIYDRFVREFGYISEGANASIMRDDPIDFPLLKSLEVNFEKAITRQTAKKTGQTARPARADKAAIFRERTREPYRAATSAKDAKEALAIVLREDGLINLRRIAKLYGKTEDEAVKDLAGLIYLDPETETWQTAALYLSGNVKKKLIQARAAAASDPRVVPNIKALEAVQPEDVPPEKIFFNIGATWMPPSVYEDFIAEELKTTARVKYFPEVNVWSVDFDGDGSYSAYNTKRITAAKLFEALLKNKDIAIYDRTDDGARVINREETAIAQETANKMARAFVDWAMDQVDRRELIARVFNERVNTTIEGKYDGSHMIFPGMGIINPGVPRDDQLRSHQKNVAWRLIQKMNGLLDHVVGSGKTFASIAAGMEMKRMGLIKKPMYVVPNHLVSQWTEDFQRLYPGARVLAIGKKDFTKARRQEFLGRIATGNWDAVLLAHTSFGFIKMPVEYELKFYRQQLDQYEQAIIALAASEGKKSRSVKQMEKARDRLKTKMKELADKPRDATVNFSELGVDALFVDEAHAYKNLFYATSRSRVAGLGNTKGSKKAFDMFVKTQYIQEHNNGRGVFFLTGTPVSNSIAEMYTMMRYMNYPRMKEMGITHFDQWANTFASVQSDWQVDATGTRYKLQSQLTFQNLPGLMSFYRDFADVVSTEDLKRWAKERGDIWPIPGIKGGKPKNVVAKRSPDQASFMEWIVHRMDNMPRDPREDNPLKATGEAMKAALDMRLIDPSLPDFKGSKVNLAVSGIFDIYQKWSAKKGTQIVFCDLSVPKKAAGKEQQEITDLRAKIKKAEAALAAAAGTDQEMAREEEYTQLVNRLNRYSYGELIAADSDFSVYDDLKAKLIAKGVPEAEIAFIHDANTDMQKAELFAMVRSGHVRVLIGSTSKMGVGMNVQNKLVALHHLDAPWRPSDLEQREGRIIRQGNEFFDDLYARTGKIFEVEIFRYATAETLDTRRWQIIERKARNIEQLRENTHNWGESLEDATSEAANAAEMKAAASGNPLILEEIQLRSEITKLKALRKGHRAAKYRAERQVRDAENFERNYADYLAEIDKDVAFIRDHPRDETPEGWQVTVADKTYRAEGLLPVPEKTAKNKDAIRDAEASNSKALAAAKERAAADISARIKKLMEDRKGSFALVYRGVRFEADAQWFGVSIEPQLDSAEIYQQLGLNPIEYTNTSRGDISIPGLFVRLNNQLKFIVNNESEIKGFLAQKRKALAGVLPEARERAAASFEKGGRLAEAEAEHARVLKELHAQKEAEAQKPPADFSRWGQTRRRPAHQREAATEPPKPVDKNGASPAVGGEEGKAAGEEGPAFSTGGLDPEMDVPVTVLNGDEISPDATGKALRSAAVDYAKVNFRGNTYHNSFSGFDIFVPRKGIDHAISHSLDDVQLRSVAGLDKMLENGVLLESKPDRGGDPNIKQYHYFYAPIKIGGKTYVARLVVRETNKGKKYYDHGLSSIEKPAGIMERGAGKTGAGSPPAAGFNIKLKQILPLVKEFRAGSRYSLGQANRQLADLTDDQILEFFHWADEVKHLDDGSIYVRHKGKELIVKRVSDLAMDSAEFEVAYRRRPLPGEKIKGEYRNGKIRLVRDLADKWTLSHETFHWMRSVGWISKVDDLNIKKAARKRFGLEMIDDVTEEDMAAWVEEKLRTRDFKGQIKPLRRLLKKLGDIIDSLISLFKRTARTFIREFESGKAFSGPSAEQTFFQKAKTEHPGVKLYRFLSETLPEWAGKKVDVIDKINRGLITNYRTDPEFVELKNETQKRILQRRELAKELARVMASFPRAEQIRIGQIIEGSVTSTPKRYEAALRAAEEFKKLSDELTDLGLLGPDNRFRQLTKKEIAEKFRQIGRIERQIQDMEARLKPITQIKVLKRARKLSETITEKIMSETKDLREGNIKTQVGKAIAVNEKRVKDALIARGFAEGESQTMIDRIKESVAGIELPATGTIAEVKTVVKKTITTTLVTEMRTTKTYSRSLMARARGSIIKDINALKKQQAEILERIRAHYKMSGKQYLRMIYDTIEKDKRLMRQVRRALRGGRLKKGYDIRRKNYQESVRKQKYRELVSDWKAAHKNAAMTKADMAELNARAIEAAEREFEKWKWDHRLAAPALALKGLSDEAHDAELMRLFNTIYNNRKWAVTEKERSLFMESKPSLGYERFKKLPKSDRLGSLSDMYVAPFIYDYLNQAIDQRSEVGRVYDEILRLWKTGKVVYNPASQCRNIMSGFVLADQAGLNIHRVDVFIKAARELKNKGRYWQEAKDEALFGVEWAGTEISTFLDEMEKLNPSGQSIFSDPVRMAKIILSVPGKSYQGIEQYFKLAVYINERDKGAGKKEAKAHAEKWTFNYQDIPSFIRWAKRWYSPFITFTYKAMPRFVETALTQPWKMVKYIIMMKAVEALTRKLRGESEDDEKREKKVLPAFMRRHVLPFQLNHLRVPYTDKYNRAKYLDMSFILPWGDVGEMWGQSPFTLIPRSFMPSHPMYIMVAEWGFNEIMFTGQPLDRDWYDKSDYAKALGLEMWRQAMPLLSPGGYSYNKLMAAAKGDKDWMGRDRSLTEAIFDTMLGIKIRSIDYTEELEQRVREQTNTLRDLEHSFAKDYKQITFRSPSDDPEKQAERERDLFADYNSRMEKIMEKITKLEE